MLAAPTRSTMCAMVWRSLNAGMTIESFIRERPDLLSC
jgi:hypothetical protein